MMTYHVQFLLLVLAGWVNRQQQDVIDYLQEENRVLRAGLRGKRVLSKNTNELKTGAPGRFDRHRPVASPRSGRVGGDVGDSGSPYAQGKHHPATGCHVPGRRPGSRPGPHLDQNVQPATPRVAPVSILGLSGGLFSAAARPPVSARSSLWRKRGTRKSGLETKTENEVLSALLARL